MEKIYGVRCHVCGIDKNSSYLLAYIRNDQPSSGVAIYFCPFFSAFSDSRIVLVIQWIPARKQGLEEKSLV